LPVESSGVAFNLIISSIQSKANRKLKPKLKGGPTTYFDFVVG